MKTPIITRLLYISILLVATAGGRLASANMITNGGFEPGDFTGITYKVGASNFSFNADSIVNNPFSGVIRVPNGGSVIGTLQNGTFNVNFGAVGATPFTLTETFIANGLSSSITLSGSLNLASNADTLTYTNGVPTFINLNRGGTLIVTPLPLGPISESLPGAYPYTLQARFAMVPDSASTWTLSLLGVTATLGLKFFVRRSA